MTNHKYQVLIAQFDELNDLRMAWLDNDSAENGKLYLDALYEYNQSLARIEEGADHE